MELEIQAKFWQNVDIPKHSKYNECWNWTGARLKNGYGVASIGAGKTELAHRVVARWAGLSLDGVIRHQCDNPSCVRPGHLINGSQSDNCIDTFKRQRRKTKLDIAAVRDIRLKHTTIEAYAQKYRVSKDTVREVQIGKTWRWVI